MIFDSDFFVRNCHRARVQKLKYLTALLKSVDAKSRDLLCTSCRLICLKNFSKELKHCTCFGVFQVGCSAELKRPAWGDGAHICAEADKCKDGNMSPVCLFRIVLYQELMSLSITSLCSINTHTIYKHHLKRPESLWITFSFRSICFCFLSFPLSSLWDLRLSSSILLNPSFFIHSVSYCCSFTPLLNPITFGCILVQRRKHILETA